MVDDRWRSRNFIFFLDDIWDLPVTSSPHSPIEIDIDETKRITKQPSSESLFLEDSDDDRDEQPPPSKKTTDVDIDALFAGLDDDDEVYRPLPALDIEAIRREARIAQTKNALSLTPHAILPSSSPPRDTAGGNSKGDDGDGHDDPKGARPRKKRIVLGEARLLGPTGFPQLIKDTKNFNVKGRGHEASDLNRLLQVYQFWTHRMYPKTQFRDTVEQVEKLCHTKRMAVALSVWRDEAHGVKHTTEDEEIIDLTEGDDQNVQSDKRTPESDAASYASSSSQIPTNPPTSASASASDLDDDDDFDIDAIIKEAEEKAAREKAARSTPRSPASPSVPKATYKEKARDTMMDVDEDEAIWEEMNGDFGFNMPPPPAANASNSSRTNTNTNTNTGSTDIDDEDMWDAVREMENEASAKTQTRHLSPPKAQVPISGLVLATDAPSTANTTSNLNAEDDWDEMYL